MRSHGFGLGPLFQDSPMLADNWSPPRRGQPTLLAITAPETGRQATRVHATKLRSYLLSRGLRNSSETSTSKPSVNRASVVRVRFAWEFSIRWSSRVDIWA